MAESFSLPLRPIVEKTDRPDSLPREIAQINTQWGSFRDVNEHVLRAKIVAEEDKDPWLDSDEADKAVMDVDTTERMDQLYKRRTEITQFAMQAHMEASFALDFISLLLSKRIPRQAETSMSPFLKQAVPVGSLNSENVNTPPRPESSVQDTKNVSRGWRLQNFNAAANKLLNSATRLETEVEAETKYWDEVLAVKEKGWTMCRLPREGQALGVQYGFLEATPIFRDRGLAALRRADDGSLVLDKGLIPRRVQSVRVRVRDSGRVSGCSTVSWPSQKDDSIESRILQARDTLFEEELFYELVREARILGNQGVTMRQDSVQLPVSEERDVILDLVDRDQEPTDEDDQTTELHENDALADALAHSIRILLSYAHRQNYRRRTQAPPPLSQKRRHTPEYQILRPIMAHLQHTSHVQWLESFLKNTHNVLQAAGLKCEVHATPFSSIGTLQSIPSIPTTEALVRVFLTPLESTFTCNLITPQSSFRIRIRTNPFSPPFDTFYDISVNLPHYPDVQPPNRLGLQDEVAAVVTHFMLLDIVSAISLQNPEPKNEVSKSPDPQASQKLTWEASYPHHGELMAVMRKGQSRKMKVSFSQKELTLAIYSFGGTEGVSQPVVVKSPTMFSQTWNADSQGPQPSLIEFVAKVS